MFAFEFSNRDGGWQIMGIWQIGSRYFVKWTGRNCDQFCI